MIILIFCNTKHNTASYRGSKTFGEMPVSIHRGAACPLATSQMTGASGRTHSVRTHSVYLYGVVLHAEACYLKWQSGLILLSFPFDVGFSSVMWSVSSRMC